MIEKDLPLVGGRRLETTLAQFERSCLLRLADLQRQANPDNTLIEVLCDAVRLARECSDNHPLIDLPVDSVPVTAEEFKKQVDEVLDSLP